MDEATLITPPTICILAEIELAHRQMQRHRSCRIDHCAWKWVAYCTLVHHSRIEPPRSSPRERASLRGISFPTDDTDHRTYLRSAPKTQTLQQVLDGLNALARDMRRTPNESSER